MGFLSKLFGKKETEPSEPKVQPSDKSDGGRRASPGSFCGAAAFNKAFRKHMAATGAFSPAEIKAMVAFLANLSQDTPRNKALYDRFVMANTKWGWPEWEERMKGNPLWDPIRKAYKKVKVADKKALLSKLGIEFDKKAKNDDLLELMLEKVTEDVVDNSCPEIKPLIEEARDKNRRHVFDRFMFHIDSYARNIENVAELRELGAEYTLHVDDEETKAKVEAILAKHPDEIPPFFPEDWTMIYIDIDSVGKRGTVPGARNGIEVKK